MKKTLLCILASLAAFSALADDASTQNTPYSPDGVVFKVTDTPWNLDTLGNHRAVVKADAEGCRAVRAELKWRRPDRRTDQTSLVVRGAETGAESGNFCIENPASESATIWFEPIKGEDTYYVYYMPYHVRLGSLECRYWYDYNDYIPYDKAECEKWKAAVAGGRIAEGKVTAFEAVNGYEAFTQMGNIATAEETARLAAGHPENPVIFTENRCFAIRLSDRLPVRWVTANAPRDSFEGEACKNEYYVWQIGLWTAHGPVDDVDVSFSDLKLEGGRAVIPASEQTCFNIEGTDWDGSRMDIDLDVPEGRIQALWCGVQIPPKAPAGLYKGTVTVSGKGMETRTISLSLNVTGETLADKGDNDLWRLARLRWLNSTIGSEITPTGEFKAIRARGRRLKATEKTMVLGKNGLPASIAVNGHEILSAPMRFEVETSGGTVSFDTGCAKPVRKGKGRATWESSQSKDGFTLSCEGRMDYDGHMLYTIRLSSDKTVEVKDVRLLADYSGYASEYLMGIGLEGGYRPGKQVWNWDGLYDSYWTGGVEAGLHMEFRGSDAYHGPLLRDYRKACPAVWYNNGKGSVSMVSTDGEARMTASTGACTVGSEPLELGLAMNITPTKPVDTRKQFSMRMYHNHLTHEEFDKAAGDGANYCNLHHAQKLNPYLNYPFIVQEPLKEFIRHEHENGRFVKMYYTIRELSSRAAEAFALKSLNHEIIAPGRGGGAPWLVEHMVDDYWPAWYVTRNGITDECWVTSPQSRWINYYMEGLRWMLENYDLDGLYMDDISFDGDVMKRLRTVMDSTRPGCIIDLHSNTGYSNGPMNQYCDYLPFVDRLWFGESFKYDEMSPDTWLVSFSGIPFGPMSEMLQDGGNNFLGAVFGASSRHSFKECDPSAVWKAWMDFGIEDSQMKGWWDEDCPVTTSDDLVKATAFVKKGSTLIALGNFSTEEKTVSLDINWKALRLKSAEAACSLPEIKGFQEAGAYIPGESVTVKPKEGLIIVIK